MLSFLSVFQVKNYRMFNTSSSEVVLTGVNYKTSEIDSCYDSEQQLDRKSSSSDISIR